MPKNRARAREKERQSTDGEPRATLFIPLDPHIANKTHIHTDRQTDRCHCHRSLGRSQQEGGDRVERPLSSPPRLDSRGRTEQLSRLDDPSGWPVSSPMGERSYSGRIGLAPRTSFPTACFARLCKSRDGLSLSLHSFLKRKSSALFSAANANKRCDQESNSFLASRKTAPSTQAMGRKPASWSLPAVYGANHYMCLFHCFPHLATVKAGPVRRTRTRL